MALINECPLLFNCQSYSETTHEPTAILSTFYTGTIKSILTNHIPTEGHGTSPPPPPLQDFRSKKVLYDQGSKHNQ